MEEGKTTVKYFIRPNGYIHEIQEIVFDNKTNTMKIVLDNKMARWFRMDEIMIVPPVIRMKDM